MYSHGPYSYALHLVAAYIVMACMIKAYIVMACMIKVYIVMACMVKAYIVMADVTLQRCRTAGRSVRRIGGANTPACVCTITNVP